MALSGNRTIKGVALTILNKRYRASINGRDYYIVEFSDGVHLERHTGSKTWRFKTVAAAVAYAMVDSRIPLVSDRGGDRLPQGG